MVSNVVIIPKNMQLYEVVRMFKEQDIGRVIVTKDEKPIGILTHSDIYPGVSHPLNHMFYSKLIYTLVIIKSTDYYEE